jgi:protein-tyrosine phosphatase
MVDIHSHVLPGVDDGARDWDDAEAMLDGLAALGFTRVAATPHFDNRALSPPLETIGELADGLRARRGERTPEILTGAEVPFDDLFLAKESAGAIPTLGGARTYLVELGFAPGSAPRGIEERFFRFTVQGGTLILAHPERCPDLQKDLARVEGLAHSGTLMQVDLTALGGKHGREARKVALELLERGLADIVASDLHATADLPLVSSALGELASWDSQELVRLASTNPGRVLAGRAGEVIRRA